MSLILLLQALLFQFDGIEAMAKLEEVSIIFEWRKAPYADEQVLRSGFLGEKVKTYGPI